MKIDRDLLMKKSEICIRHVPSNIARTIHSTCPIQTPALPMLGPSFSLLHVKYNSLLQSMDLLARYDLAYVHRSPCFLVSATLGLC